MKKSNLRGRGARDFRRDEMELCSQELFPPKYIANGDERTGHLEDRPLLEMDRTN
jgi:hypothetical protein